MNQQDPDPDPLSGTADLKSGSDPGFQGGNPGLLGSFLWLIDSRLITPAQTQQPVRLSFYLFPKAAYLGS